MFSFVDIEIINQIILGTMYTHKNGPKWPKFQFPQAYLSFTFEWCEKTNVMFLNSSLFIVLLINEPHDCERNV